MAVELRFNMNLLAKVLVNLGETMAELERDKEMITQKLSHWSQELTNVNQSLEEGRELIKLLQACVDQAEEECS